MLVENSRFFLTSGGAICYAGANCYAGLSFPNRTVESLSISALNFFHVATIQIGNTLFV